MYTDWARQKLHTIYCVCYVNNEISPIVNVTSQVPFNWQREIVQHMWPCQELHDHIASYLYDMDIDIWIFVLKIVLAII